ncbi:hypothetical protein QTG54_004911 [Skeletonema marinoi]|uniref:Uncharacterized protein n=1 Tax=Skeletonema marinoi TaxID=267567 RepID=A0AAD8YEJ2_9STRA|nr:hypothetical protein QTG54_004911 [Skeletonema marinoi]
MKRQHHKHRNKKKKKGKSSAFAKTILTCCCCPIVIAASSSNQKPPPHRLYQCAHYPQHELFSSDYNICNHRKRVRIKHQQQQFSLNLILECRGGDSMDDMYSYTHNQRADVVSAAATAIQPSTTYNGIYDEGRHDFNSHNTHSALHNAASNNEVNVINTSSTVTNNNQLNGGSSQPNDITESDTSTNQSLQNQSIISPSNQQQQRQRLMVEFDTQAIGNSDRFGNSIRSRIRSRIGNDNDWDRIMRQQRRGAALSISLDLSPSSSSSSSSSGGNSGGGTIGKSDWDIVVLSVAVRCWMFMILAGDVVGPLVLGMSGMDIRQDIGMVGTSKREGDGLVVWSHLDWGGGWDWTCFTVALSVWGGPLRLQAVAVQAEKPKQLLQRVMHHPIKWVRELEEWKHLPDLKPKISRKDGARRRRGGNGSRALDLDPCYSLRLGYH